MLEEIKLGNNINFECTIKYKTKEIMIYTRL